MIDAIEEVTFQQRAVLWGQAYEVLVKRGVLACLLEKNLLQKDHPQLRPWQNFRLLEIRKRLVHELGVLDDNTVAVIDAAVEHMALTAFGVGYTTMREYLRPHNLQLELGKLKVRALWCPLTLPGQSTAGRESREKICSEFHSEFGLEGAVDPGLAGKGMPANSDFTLWLASESKEDLLLVQEYSYDMPSELGDFREQGAHLDELLRHRRLLDSRSVFARVSAEVSGESFELSEDIKNHLGALTGENKPFYKLCQGSGYAESTVSWLQRTGVLAKACTARALAITPNGLESIAAKFTLGGPKEPRRLLMEQMGAAYRAVVKLPDGDLDGLNTQIAAVFLSVLRKLPKALKDGMKQLGDPPIAGQNYSFEFEENVPEFANPMDQFTITKALELIGDDPAATAYFEGSAKAAIGDVMHEMARGKDCLSLRDVHAATIVAGMRKTQRGKLNVIALEGNPGIGKTTAVRKYLENKEDGYLFLYVSPRVIINRDVTESLARRDGELTGILTVTTHAKLIAAAERWHIEQVKAGLDTRRHIDGAIVADGVANLKKPNGSILVIDPVQEQEIENAHTASRMAKITLSENEDLVQERSLIGVLAGMSRTTRELLELNGDVNRVVMTAALQGFREKGGGKTTMDALSNLFKNAANKLAGVKERSDFSKRISNIVVMVDELAGDGAGAPFVHGVARWLQNEFLSCFEDADQASPFSVTLVISDASLGNEVVLERYLNAGDRTPDKVLVSKSLGKQPFRIAVTSVAVNKRPCRTLHVMTNSFPASKLSIRYKVNLTSVQAELKSNGEMESPRQAVRRVSADALLESTRVEILKALTAGASQVIYFAQDKVFLSDLKNSLAQLHEAGLDADNVQVLDASVPGWKRKKLIEPATRDKVRVFLMTSSGARGVSFPLTDWIIAAVPRFNIESALMEIAQLIYRGRGLYKNALGIEVSGDNVPRQLVMLVDDFMLETPEGLDKRQWLRQSMDLMTLLVMLRATIHTRITGDAALRQPLALVPVGAVGLEELVSLMSQNVVRFIKEAEVFVRRHPKGDNVGVVKNAQANVIELFSRTRLQAVSQKGKDCRTMVKADDLRVFSDLTCTSISPLLVSAELGHSIADHIFFAGPCILENWEVFSKQESFTFEGHQTQVEELSKALLSQLYVIDKDRSISSSLREPAANLFRLLQREKQGAANEFRTLKDLKSPNTWVSVPTGYLQFLHNDETREGTVFEVQDPDLWRDALGRSLLATNAAMPPIAKYQEFPWAASVGEANPLRLDIVFDDRYFMASNELNLLNTLLLANEQDSAAF
jgi:hypothetical protein